jgi:hypothetical protein
MGWRWTLKVLQKEAWVERNFCAERAFLKRCILRSREAIAMADEAEREAPETPLLSERCLTLRTDYGHAATCPDIPMPTLTMSAYAERLQEENRCRADEFTTLARKY